MKRKTKKFQMRMHPDDHRRLMQLADLDHMTMAEWLQRAIRDAAERRKIK